MAQFPAQYATFSVAGMHLGVEVLEVQEVLCDQALRKVPLAPPELAGLINLRGQIVPALDVRRLLGLAERDRDADPVTVVLRTEQGAVSLQVDEMDDVLELDADSFEPPARNLDPALARVLRGVHKLNDRLLLVLDTARTVELGAR
jgi:purine-binding chemotaxis protein CheW